MLGLAKKKYAFPENARVIVTGAGSGIGRAFCLELARQKVRVLVVDIDEEAARDTTWNLRERGSEAHEYQCDVAHTEQVRAMVERAVELFGGVDVLINNAGVAAVGDMGEISLEDWKWNVDINLWGVVYGCHHVLPHMKAQNYGVIINVASVAAVVSGAMMSPYNVTKAGVLSLSETLNVELHQFGIGVTALLPAFVRTSIVEKSRASSHSYLQAGSRLLRDHGSTPELVARKTLRAAEKGKLYAFPHALGSNLWRLKRFAPELFSGLSKRLYESSWYQKQLDLAVNEDGAVKREN